MPQPNQAGTGKPPGLWKKTVRLPEPHNENKNDKRRAAICYRASRIQVQQASPRVAEPGKSRKDLCPDL